MTPSVFLAFSAKNLLEIAVFQVIKIYCSLKRKVSFLRNIEIIKYQFWVNQPDVWQVIFSNKALVVEAEEEIEGRLIKTHIVRYDLDRDFDEPVVKKKRSTEKNQIRNREFLPRCLKNQRFA